MNAEHRAEFILGLPYLRGELFARARKIGATVLISANSFSAWSADESGIRQWRGFRHPDLARLAGVSVCLDSAGFVAASLYRGWLWTPVDYMDLCAAAPWRWFASMDWCVEPEVAGNEETVLDRISGTVRLNFQCQALAEDRGIADRFVPVIQGWEADHYMRCLDRMWGVVAGRDLIGVGSMCRRHVEGCRGILQVVDALDRRLPAGVRLHLFGVKSQGMEELRGHPRIASFDSQAYGTAARRNADKERSANPKFSKTEVFTADVMERWFGQQQARIAKGGYAARPQTGLLDLKAPPPADAIERAIKRAQEELRDLHEAGEIDWQDVGGLSAYEFAFLDDLEDEEESPVAMVRRAA